MADRPALLLHFDVNKTIVQSDSIQLKSIEDGLREGISEMFWGFVKPGADGQLTWEWTGGTPSGEFPQTKVEDGVRLMNYTQFCKEIFKNKDMRKQAVKSFNLVNPPNAKEEMETLLSAAIEKMQMPPGLSFTEDAKASGLRGLTFILIPALFHLVANLQLEGRPFSILFRSFGGDHEKIALEWNAFCEMRHPVFSHLLKECGALDGSVPGVPDRRVHNIHTLYRDAKGPVILLNTFTNGPSEKTWDAWAKQKPKAKADEREGRAYIRDVLKCDTIEGYAPMRDWLNAMLTRQEACAIKDDWAWWTWNGESEDSGKLMLLLDTEDRTRQMFFDDNIEHDSTRIVDCRAFDGSSLPQTTLLEKYCCKVNSVEAVLHTSYFLDQLERHHGDRVSAKVSFRHYEDQLSQLNKEKEEMKRELESFRKEMTGLVGENRRMKLLRKIKINDEKHLLELLTEAGIADKFGQEGFKTIRDLWHELEHGGSWLEHDEKGQLQRVMEVCFLKIKHKDRVLIESHEQAGERIQSRNYLAAATKMLSDPTFKDAIDRFFKSGLGVDLRSVVTTESLPAFVPDAPDQQTGATMAFPIKCSMQHSEATYVIQPKDIDDGDDLGQIGLPQYKHFTTLEANDGNSITHFWRWDKLASWEAMSSRMAKKKAPTQVIDIALVCEKVFQGHPRREVYETLLLQMFETFTAKKLVGGFSGSLVIRVQPYESGGRMLDPEIVKMDAGEAIREEYVNSVAVFEALPDRAARILGDAVYARNKENEEFGAMRLELAGACWNVPELAQGGGTLLSTFKDLLLYESEQTMLGKSDSTDGVGRPFGNTNSVLAESFGPGSIVASLRNGGAGLNRHKETDLLWGWYTLKGKVSKFNPYTTTKEEYPPGPAMKRLYKKFFGHEMPDLKATVVDVIKPMLMEMSKNAPAELFPLVGLAHGDLNAANIMIDAMDAVWLIDFATSVELPLFTDMCKFEMASLFEYAAIPITPELLLEFASTDQKLWAKMNVGDWLRVDQDVAAILLTSLLDMGPEMVAAMNQSMLHNIIEETAAKTGKAPHKQVGMIRALKSRLVANEALMENAFTYCGVCSPALLQGDFLTEALYMKKPQPPPSHAHQGSASLRFFMDVAVSVRRLMAKDVMNLLRSQKDILKPVDGMCLQMWLPFLRESYRIIGYRDISPQQKIWSIYHCKIVSELVLKTLDTLKQSWSSLHDLPLVGTMRSAISTLDEKKVVQADSKTKKQKAFTQVESLWFFTNRNLFPPHTRPASLVRKVHAKDPVNCDKPGVFAPIWEVQYENVPQFLVFDADVSPETKLPEEWSIYLLDEEAAMDKDTFIGTANAWVEETRGDLGNGTFQPPKLLTPQTSPHHKSSILREESLQSTPSAAPSPSGDSDEFIGTPPTPDTEGYTHKIKLKSRLLSLSSELINNKQEELMMGVALFRQNFSVGTWSGGIIVDGLRKEISRDRRAGGLLDEKESKVERRARRSSRSPMPYQSTDLQQYLHLKCEVVSPDRRNRFEIVLVLGMPACCYPPGSKICCEQSHMPQGLHGSPQYLVWKLQESGLYKLRCVEKPDKDINEEYHPQPFNHIFVESQSYQVGQRVIFVKDQMSYLDGTVVEGPHSENGWRHCIQLSKKEGDAEFGHAESDQVSTSEKSSSKAGPTVLKHLDSMNSALMDVRADSFEDEISKVRSNVKARHSFIIDALSGMRLEVKECAMPTLTIISPNLPPPPQANETVQTSQPAKMGAKRTRVMSIVGKPGMQDDIMGDVEQKAPDKKAGWQNIMAAIDKYDKREPNCGPNAFLISGLPGGGKTSLLTRAIVDVLEKQRNFVPVLVPVTDLLKKITQAGDSFDMETSEPSVFFDMYLRTVFGEDSQRYKTIIQAKQMHRVMFLFQGLDHGGDFGPFIEKIIKELIFERHLIMMTSRPMTTDLTSLHASVSVMQLEKFNDEQKHWVAQVRLGSEGLKAYEEFVRQLKESQVPSEGQDGEEGENEQEDVFGNPMMLSMLMTYLLVRQKKKQEAEAEGKASEAGDAITLSAVYRVALEVMLAQAQSKAQAERHNKDEKMEQCKRVLERVAMEMQIRHTQELDADEVSKLIDEEQSKLDEEQTRALHDTWKSLRGAVEAGHAMFLRMTTGNNMRFFVKGFQNYFAACQVTRDKGEKLPPLEPLLTQAWYAEMLEMLADTDVHTFVSYMEQAITKYEPQDGRTFLHIAASVGHRPIFQLMGDFKESTQQALLSKDVNAMTPLHVAAEKGNTQLCRLMLEHKAPVDAEDRFGCLPMHVAMHNGHFSTGKFLLDAWISKYGQVRRDVKNNAAEEIAQKILSKRIEEEEFIRVCEGEFVELKFYVKQFAAERRKAMAALLSTYWVCGDHYDKFVRSQLKETRLSPTSWTKIQEWARADVQLTRDAEIVGAMLQFLSISSLGKIEPFRKIFSPGLDDPAESLAYVLRHYPILMPSFSRLSDDMQQMILFSTRADFNFGQFLQAENLPANLNIVKGILSEGASKNNVLGFFLFRIFVQMCGLMGTKTLEGSLMMTDSLFLNFKLGLDVLKYLKDESAQEVSDRFLGKKAEVLEMPFSAAEPQSKAMVRLVILCRVYKPEGVKQITEAWGQLDAETQAGIVKFLNADGIVQKPGFLMMFAPAFMDNAKQNDAVGPVRAMQMLLRIYQTAYKEYSDSKKPTVTVLVTEMVDWAKNATDGEVFDFTRFSVARTKGPKSEVLSSVVISPWKLVNEQEELDKIQEQREHLVHKVQAGGVKEAAFIRRIEECFPELGYFTFSGDLATCRQTKCALLSLYWACTDQAEAFTRGHHPDEKLTDATWSAITEPLEQALEHGEAMEAIFVAVAIMNLGKIKQFQEQLAPGVDDHREVLKHVMEKYPSVLPSYYSLPEPYNQLVLEALNVSFNFPQLLNAENVAYNLIPVKKMMEAARKSEYIGQVMPMFYIIANFAEVAGSMGDQSLDGSLWMTEARFGLFTLCVELVQKVADQEGKVEAIPDLYVQFLEKRAQGLDMPFDKNMPESKCAARIACLCKCFKKTEAQTVLDTFNQLNDEEKTKLTNHLTADGFSRKPAFVLVDCPAFLEAAWQNQEVTLLPALKTLLRICETATSEVVGTPTEPPAIIEIYFGRLTPFTKEFLGSVAFDNVPIDLQKHKSGVVVIPKAWIPVDNPTVFETLSSKAKNMCNGLMEGKLNEETFMNVIGRIYPEISYFSNSASIPRMQTHGAMLSIFWLTSNNYEAFTRQQPEDEQISTTSWAWIQEWLVHTVKLTAPEAVDAMMVFMAIHALGKIREFQMELAENFAEAHHDVVLAKVLQDNSQVVPSFCRLKEGYQKLIIDSLSVDFQFAQFLQAENVPANLAMVKKKLEPHGDDGFAFFCFRIFATMCGRLGYKSLEGSLFMTEAQFQRFRPGLEAFDQLRKLDASATYNAFLLQRASKTLVRFASKEHGAIARLLCICSANDQEAGSTVVEAFEQLRKEDKDSLANWLCSDPAAQTDPASVSPGYVLSDLSAVIKLAMDSQGLALVHVFTLLAKIQRACENVVRQSGQVREQVIVQMEDISRWIKEVGPNPDDFLDVSVNVRQIPASNFRTEAIILQVEVAKPSGNGTRVVNGVTNGVTNGTVRPGTVAAQLDSRLPGYGLNGQTLAPSKVSLTHSHLQGGLSFRPNSRTRRLAAAARAQKNGMAGSTVNTGTVTRL